MRSSDSLPTGPDSINSKTSNNNKLYFEPAATVCARFRLTFPQLASGGHNSGRPQQDEDELDPTEPVKSAIRI